MPHANFCKCVCSAATLAANLQYSTIQSVTDAEGVTALCIRSALTLDRKDGKHMKYSVGVRPSVWVSPTKCLSLDILD